MKTTPKDLFEILVREHSPSLMAYLRSVIRDSAMAEDLFQETMLVAWKNIDSFDRTRPFGPWLRGIAGKLVLAHYRTDARRFVYCDEVVLEQLDQRLEALQQKSGDGFEDRLDLLRECLKRLPDPYREVIDARYKMELKGQSLADHLKQPMEAVKKRLQRARQRLLECMTPKWASPGYQT